MLSTPAKSVFRGLLLALSVAAAVGSAHADAGWLDAAWSRRMPFTAKADSVEGTDPLTNFPILVQLSSAQAAVFTRAASDGRDLRFTSADGVTPLEAEIVRYDAGSQQAEIWVRADVLSKTSNQFYMYYGNPLASSASTSAVWSDYKAVYHFEQDPAVGTLLDSSPAQAHASTMVRQSATWTSGDLVAAKIGRGWHYDTNKTVNTNGIRVATATWTMSAWLKHDSHGTDFFTQSDPCYFHLSSQSSDVSWDVQYEGGYCGAPPDYRWLQGGVKLNEWHHFAWVYDGPSQQIAFYYDGVARGIYTIYPVGADVYNGHTLNPDGSSLTSILGPMWANGMDEMNGTGDEFRVRPQTRTAAWMRTEFRNQNAPQQFYVFGQEETTSTQSSSFGALKSTFD